MTIYSTDVKKSKWWFDGLNLVVFLFGVSSVYTSDLFETTWGKVGVISAWSVGYLMLKTVWWKVCGPASLGDQMTVFKRDERAKVVVLEEKQAARRR